jgi:hypothetical protein
VTQGFTGLSHAADQKKFGLKKNRTFADFIFSGEFDCEQGDQTD